jgi:O-antigen/teichoic acid export membrane protein
MPEKERGERTPSVRPLVAARAFSAGVTVLIPIVLARLLSVSEYGTFKQFFLVSATLYLVLGLGVPQSLYYFLPRCDPSEKRAHVFHTLVFLAFFGAVGAMAILLSGPLLTRLGGPSLAKVALPLALYVAGYLGGAALEPGLTAQGRPGAAAISYVVSDSLRAAAFVVPVLLGRGLSASLWGAVGFAAYRLAASWFVLLRGTSGAFVRPRLFSSQLRYALPYGGAMLVAMPQQQLHQYAVSLTSSPAAFAVYSVGCFNLPLVDLLYTPTTEILMYRIGEMERHGHPKEEAIRAFRDAVARLAYAFVPLALGVFVIAPSFLGLLYGPNYVEATPILRVALASVLLAILPVDGVLRAKAKTRLLLFSYLGKIAVSVPLVFGFLHALGPIGAMVGFVCTEAIHKAFLLAFAARALAERPGALRAVLPFGAVAKAGFAALAAAVLAGGAQVLFPLEPLPSVVLHGGAFGLAYLGAMSAGGMGPGAWRRMLTARH